MIKAQPGFSLIELLIASGIAALLTGALFTFVWQTNKGAAALDWAVDAHFKAIIVQRTLERDLAGAFVPGSLYAYYEQQAQQETKKNKQAVAITDQKEKPIKKIEKVFYATAHNNELLMTFITNNPLPVYSSLQAGKPQPRIVRVTYRLKQDETTKNKRYTLWREESNDLEFNDGAASTGNSYQLASEIKECQVTFVSYEEVASDDPSASEKKEPEAKKVTEWDREQVEIADGKPKEPLIPNLITFAITFGQPTGKRSMSTECAVAILPKFGPFPVAQARKKEEPPAKTPAQSLAPNTLGAPATGQAPELGKPATPAPGGPLPGLMQPPAHAGPPGIKGITQRPRASSLQSLFGFPFERR